MCRFMLSLVMTLCSIAGVTRAQVSPEAEALFREGKSLIREGKISAACISFEASEGVEHSVATVLSLADCRERNHQYASAWVLFLQADTQTRADLSKAALNRTARLRATMLEPKLSYLIVSVPDDSRVDGLTLTRNGRPFDSILWNRALPVDGGDYLIAGHAVGTERWQVTVHVADSGVRMSVSVPKLRNIAEPGSSRLAAASRTSSLTQGSASSMAIQEISEAPPPDGSSRTGYLTSRRRLALWMASAGALSGIVGALLGVAASAKQDDAFRLCPHASMPCAQADRANTLLESGRARAFGANVTIGVGAALGITAGALWLLGAPVAEARHVRVWPGVSAGHAGIVLAGWL